MEIRDIETNRFYLRKTLREDSIDIFKLLSDQEIIKTLNMPIHKSIEDTNRLLEEYLEGIEKGIKYPYTIIDKNTGTFIGIFLIKLDLYNDDAYECTVYLAKEFWGKKVYTEILPYMIKVVFEGIKTKNFRGYVMEKNIASRKGLEKLGFTLEKIFNVPGIEDKIYSFLMTDKMYKEII